jgi:signal peptidase I
MKRGWIIAIAAVVLFCIVGAAGIIYFVSRFGSYYARSGAMAPAIPKDTVFLADRFAYRSTPPARGDVVVFVPPIPSGAPFYKRVVGVPGDRIAIRDGRMILNGKLFREPYTREKLTNYDLAVRDYGIFVDGNRLGSEFAAIPPRSRWDAPDAVPRGCYVVLGDDRNNSEDSHVFGFLCPGLPSSLSPKSPPALIGRAMIPAS